MVIVRIWEGLGNQMFQYAYARALKERGVDVRLDLNRAYDDVFKERRGHDKRENVIQNYRITLPPIDVCKYGKYNYLYQDDKKEKILYWLGSHHLGKYKFYEEKDLKFKRSKMCLYGNYYVKGWFQNENYFKSIRSILIREFVPCKQIKVSLPVRMAMENMESVSIHVRRGDYVKFQNALNIQYYEKAVAYIKKIYANPIFMIFSDDIEWTKQNLNINGECIYVNEEGRLKDYEELFIMSRCKSNIIANSTYSWWGAWLNQNLQKVVIAPRSKWKNIIPTGWITV